MHNFDEKIAVITEAGSGMGRSFTLQLYAAGARLALCDIDLTGIEETFRLTGETGNRVSLYEVDVSNRKQMSELAIEVIALHGAVDILVNNASISLTPLTFEDTSNELFDKVININMWGIYNGIRTFIPYLRLRPEANIVNISSLAGLVGLYSYSAYSMSKSAVRGLTEALQSELAGSTISVLLVHPGGVKTNIINNAPNLSENQREAAHVIFKKSAMLNADQTVSKILRAMQKMKTG